MFDREKNRWEVVCYDVKDWKRLASKLKGSGSKREAALRRLIIDNFLPNLPKIVEDMVRQGGGGVYEGVLL